MYERLCAIGFTPHHGDDGWWLGHEHELWILREQQRIYGPAATLSETARQAMAIMLGQEEQLAAA